MMKYPLPRCRRVAACFLLLLCLCCGAVAAPTPWAAWRAQLRNPDARQRVAAVQAIAEYAGAQDFPHVLQALNSALHDRDARVRLAAFTALNDRGESPAANRDLLALLRDPDAQVRAAVAAAGWWVTPRETGNAALLRLLQDPALSVRVAAVDGLMRLQHHPSVIAPLLQLLHSPTPALRAAAARALGALADTRTNARKAVITSLAALLNDPDAGVRHAAAASLYALHDPRATLELVYAALTDAEAQTRLAAIAALVSSHDVSLPVADRLASLLMTERDPLVRREVALQLYTCGTRCSSEKLLPALQDADLSARIYVVRMLGNAQELRALDPLLAQAHAEDTELRAAVLDALGNLGDTRALPSLLAAAAHDTVPDVRCTAFRALHFFRDPRIAEVAAAFLHDKDKTIRLQAALTLAENGMDSGYQALAPYLLDRDARSDVYYFLGSANDPRALALLLTVQPVPMEAADAFFSALGHYRDPRVPQRFLSGLRDARRAVRKSALSNLFMVRKEALLPTLRLLWTDAVPEIRSQALQMCAYSDGLLSSTDVPALTRALHDSQAGVRVSAVRALASLENAAARQVLVQRLSQEADAAVLEEIAHALWRGLHTAVPLGQQAHPLLRHRNSEVRVAGLRLLEFTTLDTALLPVVAGMLSDTVVSVREGAARLLSRYSHAPDATMGLLRALRDPQSAVRNAACQYIHSGSAPLLLLSLQQIAEDPQDTRRPEAISALGHAGAAYTPTLLQIAADAQDPLRVAAIHALAKPADTAVVDGILPLLPTAPPPVRQEILAILATSDDPRTVEVFVPLLQATDAGERLLATQALASATDPRVAQALLAQFPAQCGEAELRAIAYHPEDNGDPEQATPSLPLRTALTLQRIGDPAIAALDQLLADTQPSRRAAAAALLCLQRDGRSVPLLAAALHDTDVQVRLFAAHALCLRGVLESLPALTAAAGDADARVRAEVALALGALEDRRATATLTTLLRDTDADVQLAAALSLRRLADPQATPALLAALDAAPDTGVGTAILFALGASADPRAATAALAALSRTDPLLRGSAIYTLGKLHASQAVAPLCALISQGALNQNTDQAVQQYNQRLQRLGAPSMSMLDASLSIIAIQALGEIGDAAALPTLQALLTTVEPQQFALVLAAYAHCGAPATAVQQHLADDTYRSSNYSSSTTVFYDPALHAAVSEAMLKRLRSRDVEVQTATLQFFLARFRNTFEDPAAPRSWVAQLAPRLIDATLPLLAAQDAKVRQSAATLLGYLRTPRATQPLLARLGTADSNEALTIGAALAMIADPHAIDPLLQLLSQGKPVLRAGVIYALTPLHSPQVADALARVLQNPDQQLRMLAARALAVQHDTRAVAPLLEQSDAPEVSLYNLLPLVSMADARVAEALLRLLADRKNQQFGFLLWMSPDARVTTALLGHLQSLDTLGASALMGIPDLLHMADQPTPEIQLCFGEFADTARAKLHDPQVLAALLTMLRQYQRYMPDRVAFARSEHGYYSPAQSALSLLGTSGDTTATPALIDCLERGNSDFRQAAAAALGQLKDRRAIAPLIRALGEFGGTARPTVATALAALTGQSFGTDAEQWQTWWEAQPGR